jgi:hypothetical protein
MFAAVANAQDLTLLGWPKNALSTSGGGSVFSQSAWISDGIQRKIEVKINVNHDIRAFNFISGFFIINSFFNQTAATYFVADGMLILNPICSS